MKNENHWSDVYQKKAFDSVSWYQPSPKPSLAAIEKLNIRNSVSIIDVGGGASTFVDHLIGRGWTDVTVLDIAAPALEVAKSRIGGSAAAVKWEVADITQWQPKRMFDVWHDRAVFHFLTDADHRQAYLRVLQAALAKNGAVVMATFAMDGPEKCSGLPIERYDPPKLAHELGRDFKLLESWREQHITPGGNIQSFNWCIFRRI